MDRIPVALPPLKEQRRIIAKLDELMVLCDELEAAQRERESRRGRLTAATHHHLNNGADAESLCSHAQFFINHLPRLTARPDQIKQLRQTILNLAARGKLVPQRQSDGSGWELLEQIQHERSLRPNKGRAGRDLDLEQKSVSNENWPIPATWAVVALSHLLFEDSQNGFGKKPDDVPDGIPILRISAGTVRADGIVAEEEHKLIGGVSEEDKKKFQLIAGDLLACRFNGNRRYVGRLSLYEGYLGLSPIYPDKLIRLRVFPDLVSPKLVRNFAECDFIRKDIEGYCATTVGNWGISASNLKEVVFPLPPLGEQLRIVAKVDELMALCDQLEGRLTTAQAEAGRLLESVLHNALNASLPTAEAKPMPDTEQRERLQIETNHIAEPPLLQSSIVT